jgi:hypothetical protein
MTSESAFPCGKNALKLMGQSVSLNAGMSRETYQTKSFV